MKRSSSLNDGNPSSSANADSRETSSSGELQGKEDGVLTVEMVSSGLSQSGFSNCVLQHIYYNLSLPCCNLKDISVLHKYINLHKLELSQNKIKDLSCLGHMPYLVILDASHNEIHDFFEFKPPQYLREVNFSHNQMTEMKDLSAFVFLCKLDLDYNRFTEILGLEQCYALTHLSLAHNKITKISGLDSLPLTHLCLKGNQIKRIEGLESIKSLQVLDLSMNRITRLSGLQNLHLLGSFNLEKNQINEIHEFEHLQDLLLLRDLNLKGNPVQEDPEYRLSVIFFLQHLTVLDQVKISAEEKVSSVNKYDPPLDVLAARDHMTNLVFQLTQPQVLYDSTLPDADSPYPMLVLTGPEACGKRELVHRLCQEFSEYFGFGICHTTRKPYFGEENGIDYHFISEEDFQNMTHMGKFIQTMQYGDHQYGLTRDAVEDMARGGLVCCVHMELESVFSLKKSYLEPRCILLIPNQVEKYRNSLKSQERYTQTQIDAAVSRLELYTNTQRPGFFDCIIPCDDWEEAYQTLRQVVKGYLSPEEEEEEEKNSSRTSPDSNLIDHNPTERPTSSLFKAGSGILTSCTASASDPSGFTDRPYKNRAELSSAELTSIRRQEQLLSEAFVWKHPGVHSQLFKSLSPTASSSQHNQDPGAHNQKEDSNSDESCAISALSVPSSAGTSGKPLQMSILIHSLDSLKDTWLTDLFDKEHVASGQISATSQPGADELDTFGSSSSDSHPGSKYTSMLPPSPTGQISAVSSSTQSSRLSPDLAVEEKGDANVEESF